MQHVLEVSSDVAMCLGPDGIVVAEVDEAVSIAVEMSTDRCLIEQMCTADLWLWIFSKMFLPVGPLMKTKTRPNCGRATKVLTSVG